MVSLTSTDAGPRRPPTGGRRRPPTRLRVAGVLLGAALAIGGAGGYSLLHHDTAAPAAEPHKDWGRRSVTVDQLPAQLGVRLRHVAVTGGGGLLDVRFQVTDPDLAAAIHDASTPPAVVDESSGLFLAELLMGHAHSGPFKPAVTYYLIFVNDANWVHRGSKVTLLLGGVQVEHVRVE